MLEVVTSADLDNLRRLEETSRAAEQALRSLSDSPHVIDTAYMDQYASAFAADEAARSAYLRLWRELFA